MSDNSREPSLKQVVSPELAEVITDEANRSSQVSKKAGAGVGAGAAAGGYVGVAKRISSRATDLLAISIIAIAGLTMGEHLVDWWSAEQEPLTVPGRGDRPADVSWGVAGNPIDIRFADRPYTISREIVRGDRDQALRVLQQNCRGIVAEPQRFFPGLGEITAAERRMLDASAQVEPIQQSAGNWQLYKIERPLLMIVGTRQLRGSVESEGDGGRGERRVVGWSLALPSGKGRWALFTYRPGSRNRTLEAVAGADSARPVDAAGERQQPTAVSDAAGLTDEWPVTLLPPESRPVLSLRDGNSAFIVFKGGDRLDASVAFYRTWFDQNGWQQELPWKTFPLGRSARYYGNQGRVDVQLRLDAQGALDGVLYVQFQSKKQGRAPTKGDP